MLDDHPQEEKEIDKTALYYINRRIDKLDEAFKERHLELKGDIADLRNVLVENNKACWQESEKVEIRVNKLEGFKNRAIGAIGIIVLLIGIWKVA